MLHLELIAAKQKEMTRETVIQLFEAFNVISLQQKEGCSEWKVGFETEKDIDAAVSKAKESGLFSKVYQSKGETEHNHQEDYEIVSKAMEEQHQLHNKLDGELELLERIMKDKEISQREEKRNEEQSEEKVQQQKIQKEDIQNEKNNIEEKDALQSSEWGESMDNLVLDSQEEITQQKEEGSTQNREETTAEIHQDQQTSAESQIQAASSQHHYLDQENFEPLDCEQQSQETCSFHSNQEVDDHTEQEKTTLFLLKCFEEASVLLNSLKLSTEYYKSQGKSAAKSNYTKSSYFNKAISNRNFRIAVFALFSVYFAITSTRI